jgi:hypothetical protein
MKKLFLLAVLACVSTFSFADDCGGISIEKVRDKCYEAQIGVMAESLGTYYVRIEKSGVLTAEQVERIHKGHTQWLKQVDESCPDVPCINRELEQRLGRIYHFYKTEIVPRMAPVEKKSRM